MIWYKSETNFLQTHEADCLLFDFGMDAIGVYFGLCGLVASMVTAENICFDVKHSVDQLAYKFHMNTDRLKSIMDRCVELNLFVKTTEGLYSIPSLGQKLDEFTKKSVRKENTTSDNVRTMSGQTPDKLQTDSGLTPERIDKIRIEENREDIGEKVQRSKRFTPPLPQEVQAYLDERKITKFNAEKFISHYTANGWMVGKNRMKDWKAAVRTWEQNDFNSARAAPPGPPVKQYKEFSEEYEQ